MSLITVLSLVLSASIANSVIILINFYRNKIHF